MEFLVPNYRCLQNPWLGGYRPQIPILSSVLNWICWTPPPPKNIPGYATDALHILWQIHTPSVLHFYFSLFFPLLVQQLPFLCLFPSPLHILVVTFCFFLFFFSYHHMSTLIRHLPFLSLFFTPHPDSIFMLQQPDWLLYFFWEPVAAHIIPCVITLLQVPGILVLLPCPWCWGLIGSCDMWVTSYELAVRNVPEEWRLQLNFFLLLCAGGWV